MTSGSSSSSRAGAGPPASRRSRRVCPAILTREPGGQACSGPRRARGPSRACSRRCAIRTCGIFWAEFPRRRWCFTGAATAPFASAPAGISAATSRRRGSSNSTAPITGSSRAISNPSWPASSNSLATRGPIASGKCRRKIVSQQILGRSLLSLMRGSFAPVLMYELVRRLSRLESAAPRDQLHPSNAVIVAGRTHESRHSWIRRCGEIAGRGFIKHGHQVVLGTRDPASSRIWSRSQGSAARSFADAARSGRSSCWP